MATFLASAINVTDRDVTGPTEQVQIMFPLRWLKTVSSTYIWMGRYNQSLSLDATIMISKHCPIIGEHVVIIFLTQ